MSRLPRLDVDPDPDEPEIITLRTGTMVVLSAGMSDPVVAVVTGSEVRENGEGQPDTLHLVLALPETLEDVGHV